LGPPEEGRGLLSNSGAMVSSNGGQTPRDSDGARPTPQQERPHTPILVDFVKFMTAHRTQVASFLAAACFLLGFVNMCRNRYINGLSESISHFDIHRWWEFRVCLQATTIGLCTCGAVLAAFVMSCRMHRGELAYLQTDDEQSDGVECRVILKRHVRLIFERPIPSGQRIRVLAIRVRHWSAFYLMLGRAALNVYSSVSFLYSLERDCSQFMDASTFAMAYVEVTIILGCFLVASIALLVSWQNKGLPEYAYVRTISENMERAASYSCLKCLRQISIPAIQQNWAHRKGSCSRFLLFVRTAMVGFAAFTSLVNKAPHLDRSNVLRVFTVWTTSLDDPQSLYSICHQKLVLLSVVNNLASMADVREHEVKSALRVKGQRPNLWLDRFARHLGNVYKDHLLCAIMCYVAARPEEVVSLVKAEKQDTITWKELKKLRDDSPQKDFLSMSSKVEPNKSWYDQITVDIGNFLDPLPPERPIVSLLHDKNDKNSDFEQFLVKLLGLDPPESGNGDDPTTVNSLPRL